MTKLEKLADRFAQGTDSNSADAVWGFEAGWRACREAILAVLDEVGPGAADTMGVSRDFGEETRVDNEDT
jgi:hypothetical protein